MIRIISIASLFALAGCITTRTDDALNCEAMRPDLPVKYHAKTTDPETIANIRRANARFTAACG
jgi:hypothetical protein